MSTSKDDQFDTINHPKNKQKVLKTYGSIRSRLRPKPSRAIDESYLNSKLEKDNENFEEIKSSTLTDSQAGPSKPKVIQTKPFLRSRRVNEKPSNLLLDRSNAQEPTRKREMKEMIKNENPSKGSNLRKKKIKVLEDQEIEPMIIDSSLFLEHSMDPPSLQKHHQRDYPMQQGMNEEINLRFNRNEHEKALESIPPIPFRKRLRHHNHEEENLSNQNNHKETDSIPKKKNSPERKKKKMVEKSVKVKSQRSLDHKKDKEVMSKENPMMLSGEKFVPLDDDEYSDDPLRI
ncbi:hypothetical protein DFH28DRAFT_412824 [Melampsora americana]|nr:hypothetical protein DFH28DRAFT_412824 [Melampsora americana]